ncbi:hypothetical protein D1BOALGB6SA_2602 [Olavius sp. associated proteobacterium Delta 1]|nr:hypothetical protein D1BOALGB6SA_2602 [Olavius sp. associated proteobacterium Delta 1]
MSQEVDIYTETMAKVYADQGHWLKVIDIYRHLLAIEPERLDYADALAEAENRLKMKEMNSRKAPEQLVPLFREWIELLFKFDKLQKLKKLKRIR